MIKECKKCGSKNLYLEPRIKGQDVLTADMAALKCKDCGVWLKWCPKNERVNYLKIEKPDKWQKLKEWLEEKKSWNERQLKEAPINTEFYIRVSVQGITINKILDKMQELEENKYDMSKM